MNKYCIVTNMKTNSWWAYTKTNDRFVYYASYVSGKLFTKDIINESIYNGFNSNDLAELTYNEDYEIKMASEEDVKRLIENV